MDNDFLDNNFTNKHISQVLKYKKLYVQVCRTVIFLADEIDITTVLIRHFAPLWMKQQQAVEGWVKTQGRTMTDEVCVMHVRVQRYRTKAPTYYVYIACTSIRKL